MIDIQLSEHFKLSEFTNSSTASARHIDNTLSESNPQQAEIIANLRNLCENVLEPLRQWYGKPITISSGFRCPTLNSHPEVRGATNSQHMKGEAVDLHLPSIPIGRQWVEWLLDNVRFDHLIWEHDRYGHYWIHISYKRVDQKNRQLYTPNLLKK